VQRRGPRGSGLITINRPTRPVHLVRVARLRGRTRGDRIRVTEDHLPFRWDCGTRPARHNPRRAIRRRATLPFCSNCPNCLAFVLRRTSRDHAGSPSPEPVPARDVAGHPLEPRPLIGSNAPDRPAVTARGEHHPCLEHLRYCRVSCRAHRATHTAEPARLSPSNLAPPAGALTLTGSGRLRPTLATGSSASPVSHNFRYCWHFRSGTACIRYCGTSGTADTASTAGISVLPYYVLRYCWHCVCFLRHATVLGSDNRPAQPGSLPISATRWNPVH